MAEQVTLTTETINDDDDDEKYEEYIISSDEEKGDDDGFIMLTEDNEVQKKIILCGDDDCSPITPPRNCTVSCHYIARLIQNGKQFDTSRKKGLTKSGKKLSPKPFQFELGKGKVIKAWDICIKTMKKNEIAILRCSPNYGYGQQGKDDTIPPNSWLEFEIELIEWNEWQEIDNNINLRKKVICNGYKSIIAKPDDLVSLSYKAYIPSMDNYLFASQDNITIICDDNDQFPDGFHISLQNMEEGEHAIIEILDYDLAFGAEGDIELNIPYFADICYQIHIHHINKAKPLNEYTELEKLERAKKFKIEGNQLFGKKSYKSAIKKYRKSLRWSNFINSDDYYKEKLQMLIDINNNLGLIYMKKQDYDSVIEYSSKVLTYDQENIKALSRSGHAKIKKKKYIEAKIDLKKAKKIDGNNSYISKLLTIAITKVKQEKEKQKKQYHSMFGYRPEKSKRNNNNNNSKIKSVTDDNTSNV